MPSIAARHARRLSVSGLPAMHGASAGGLDGRKLPISRDDTASNSTLPGLAKRMTC